MFNTTATEESVQKTKAALEQNGFKVLVVKTGEEAKQKVLELVPKSAEVFALSSTTLQQIGITKEVDESGNYDSVRKQLSGMDPKTQGREMARLGAAPEFALGSAHAVTEDGKVFIASNTGSQLPADAYGAGQVIWVVGTQKIVKDEAQAKERIYSYVLPLESVRLNKQYNLTTGSFVSKLLTFYREFNPNRITIILVEELLGF